jgi:hypothetical protein
MSTNLTNLQTKSSKLVVQEAEALGTSYKVYLVNWSADWTAIEMSIDNKKTWYPIPEVHQTCS